MSSYHYYNYYRFVNVIGFNEDYFVNYEQKRILKRSNTYLMNETGLPAEEWASAYDVYMKIFEGREY